MHKTDVDKLLGKNPSRRRKILLEFAKQPSGVANKVMAETLHIDYSDLVGQHLSVFEEFGVIKKCDVVVKRPMGRVKTPTEISMKGYRLNHDTNAVHQLVAVFNPDLQTMFMRSPYYRSMIPDLVQQFKDSIPDNDLVKLDTYTHTATREQPLIEDDESRLTNALEKNWLALKWVEHFISVEADERGSILRQLLDSVRNSKISPTAADAEGYAIGRYHGMVKARPWVDDIDKVVINTWINEKGDNEKEQLTYASACRQAHPDFLDIYHRRDEPRIKWEELFNQLDNLNSNYQYLFD